MTPDESQAEPLGEPAPSDKAKSAEAEGALAGGTDIAPSSIGETLTEARFQTMRQAYAETGSLYRQFSGRRGRLFAGFLVTVAVVVIGFVWAWIHPMAKPMAWIVMAAGCLLTFVFWALERRTRHVSYACIQTGSKLERALGLRPDQGVFTSLIKLPSGEPAPGRTFDWMYLVAALGLLVGTVYALTGTS